jgi:hypothetical protein
MRRHHSLSPSSTSGRPSPAAPSDRAVEGLAQRYRRTARGGVNSTIWDSRSNDRRNDARVKELSEKKNRKGEERDGDDVFEMFACKLAKLTHLSRKSFLRRTKKAQRRTEPKGQRMRCLTQLLIKKSRVNKLPAVETIGFRACHPRIARLTPVFFAIVSASCWPHFQAVTKLQSCRFTAVAARSLLTNVGKAAGELVTSLGDRSDCVLAAILQPMFLR